MKLQKMLLGALVLLNLTVLNGSVKLNSLGEYFSYIVPDADTDIEQFPVYLNEYAGKHFQFDLSSNQNYDDYYLQSGNINFQILPLFGRFSYKLKLNVSSNSDNYYFEEIRTHKDRIYLNNNNENSYSKGLRISNIFSYKITNNFKIGALLHYGNEWNNINNNNDETGNYYNEYISSNDFDMNAPYYSVGLNFCFGKNLIKNIGFIYDKYESDGNVRYYRKNNHISYDNENIHIYEDSDKYEKRRESFQFISLIEKKDKKKYSRIYFAGDYTNYEENFNLESNDESLNYDSDILEHRKITDKVESENLTKRNYSAVCGFGTNAWYNGVNLFYGFKLSALYGDYEKNEEKSYFSYEENIYSDSTEVDSSEFSYSQETPGKEYCGIFRLPLGAEYKLSKKISLLFGIGFEIKYQKIKIESGEEFVNWDTNHYQNLGIEFNPNQKLSLGMNFNGQLSSYSRWELDLKYLF